MVVVVKKFWDWQLTREFLKQYLNEKQNCYCQSGHLWEVVAYKKWSLWETVDCSRAAGCGGEGNDGGVDWYVDGDSGCGSYCFDGSEGVENCDTAGDKADDGESDNNDSGWDCAVDVTQKGGGGNTDSHYYDNITVVLL